MRHLALRSAPSWATPLTRRRATFVVALLGVAALGVPMTALGGLYGHVSNPATGGATGPEPTLATAPMTGVAVGLAHGGTDLIRAADDAVRVTSHGPEVPGTDAGPAATPNPASGCGECAYYMQEGSTVDQICLSTGCTSAGGGVTQLEVVVQVNVSPYHTGFELNGLTNVGDWYQSMVGEDWCANGLEVMDEAWSTSASISGPCVDSSLTIDAGDWVELGLYVSTSGATSGDVCFTASDLTHAQPEFVNCVSQPDGGTSPASNYFELGSEKGYFSGPMSELYDTSASACESYHSMPTVTYRFVGGVYVTSYTPWSDEWNPSTDDICYSTTETSTARTLDPGNATAQVADGSADSTYGPHWVAAQNTTSFNASSWWAFTTDFTLPPPTASPRSVDQGEGSVVSFSDLVAIVPLDSNTPYLDWTTGASTAVDDCSPSGSGAYDNCTLTGSVGSITVQTAAGETGGYALDSPPLVFNVYGDPTVSTPTPSLAAVDVGQAVSFTVVASGGSGNFSYVWNDLPTGCIGTTATVACSDPTSAGTFPISATATDSNGYAATSGTLEFTVYAGPIVATPVASRPSVDLGQSVTFSESASGGVGTLSYAWSGLPAGCASTTASFACTPTATTSGTSVTVTVEDANDFRVTSAPLGFTVYSVPTVALTASAATVTEGGSVTLTAATDGGAGGTTYAWSGLPAGCASSDSAALACSPTVAGTFSITVVATDANGLTASSTTSLVVDTKTSAGTPSLEIYAVAGGAIAAALLGGGIAWTIIVRRRRR